MPPALVRSRPYLSLALVVAGWAALFRGPLVGVWAAAPSASLRLNAALGLGLVALVWARSRRAPLRPALRWPPLAVITSAVVAYLGPLRALDIDLLSCGVMVAGAWGIAGLYLHPARWRQALPLALLGVCILPMGPALDVYLGFPLRVATAGLTHAALLPFGVGEITTETIVLIEGGGVQIDLPCSGVRSLWSGAIFWATATFIERRRVGPSWVAGSIGFVALLVVLNGARVLALVLLHAFAPQVAMDVLHVPLGLVAFATATGLGWLLLRRLPAAAPIDGGVDDVPGRSPAIAWLGVVLLALSAIPTGRAGFGQPPAIIELHDPSLSPIELDAAETALFRTRGATAVGKWEFSIGRARGQLVMVEGASWRAQHRPDICHAARGRTIEEDAPVLIGADFPARRLELRQGDGDAAAYYWFQSADATTNDYGARIWAALDGDPEPFVMVSVMVDPPLPRSDPELHALLLRIHAHAHLLLTPPAEAIP